MHFICGKGRAVAKLVREEHLLQALPHCVLFLALLRGQKHLLPVLGHPFLWALSASWQVLCTMHVVVERNCQPHCWQQAVACRSLLNPPDQAGAPTLQRGPWADCPTDLWYQPWVQSKAQMILFEDPAAKPLLIRLDGGDRNDSSSKLPKTITRQDRH